MRGSCEGGFQRSFDAVDFIPVAASKEPREPIFVRVSEKAFAPGLKQTCERLLIFHRRRAAAEPAGDDPFVDAQFANNILLTEMTMLGPLWDEVGPMPLFGEGNAGRVFVYGIAGQQRCDIGLKRLGNPFQRALRVPAYSALEHRHIARHHTEARCKLFQRQPSMFPPLANERRSAVLL